jgi:AcrR family transcriptional regulator
MSDASSVPRGRHAPPLAVRQDRQRRRLNEAAAAVFARVGYADATAEAIAREAGMSKATFYEHFDNKEDCILALFDAATERLMGAMTRAAAGDGSHKMTPAERYRSSAGALLDVVGEYRDFAQTLLVEIIGAGPRAMQRRDGVLLAFAQYIDARNAEDAAAGTAARLPTLDDSIAIVGAIFELLSRHIRLSEPPEVRELVPVVERLFQGQLAAAAEQRSTAA